jgi:hypothetical protein
MPDSHGQIWTEVGTLSTANSALFRGSNDAVGENIVQTLSLSRFPIRRLMTLWKNTHWQPVITRWCQSAIGRATFNATTWESMARCRIDEVSP